MRIHSEPRAIRAPILILVSSLALSGCNTLRAQSRVDPIRIASYGPVNDVCMEPAFPGDTNGGAVNLDCFRFRDVAGFAYVLAAKDRGHRNRLASILMSESNTVCTREMGNLTAHEAMVNAGLATATTAFSTVGAIVSGKLASNILSGLASGTNATRGHINSEVYRNVLAVAVSKAIRLERDKQRAAIRAKYVSEWTDYSVDEMIEQVNQYHQTCSFYRGLDLVITAVDRTAYYNSDPRRTSAFAIDNVRAQIASIRRQIAHPKVSQAEKAELEKQLATLREHETALIKAWTALPTAMTDPASEPAAGPAPAPELQPDASNPGG